MNLPMLLAIMRKDASCLAPIAALTALLFLTDPLIVRLDLLPLWTEFRTTLILLAPMILTFAVFQLDAAASLSDDWLCRPIGWRELVAAKLLLLAGVIYVPQALGTLVADLWLGLPPSTALLDALLLQEELLALLIPFYLLIAMCTRTFVQGFAVQFAAFIALFVLPTPFVRPPGPLSPGIQDGILVSGLLWLGTIPAHVVSIAMAAVGAWLSYQRRNLLAARVLLGAGIAVTAGCLLLPMGASTWNAAFAAQTGSGPRVSSTARIGLRPLSSCFPAASLSDRAALFKKFGLPDWEEEQLARVGPASLAFVTRLEPTGLPLDWRVKLSYVEAEYLAGGARISLRPTKYLTDAGGAAALSHGWTVPESTLVGLRGADTRLRLRYSLTLLEPREHRVPTDGTWRELPGVGACRAIAAADRIDIDCVSTRHHPAQISAELDEIPATRVFGAPDFAPRWAQLLQSDRVHLAIGSRRLSARDSVTVTAWENAGHVQPSITLTGMLGGDAQTCPLPDANATKFAVARWQDSAPHTRRTLTVDKGVQLEILDFGGTGAQILMLHGLGATAHAYDEIAPLLARGHRVVAITRRGTGYSSKPDFGFDTQRLGLDVLAVVQQLDLRRPLLVGHSIAGEELTWLGAHHGDRFSGLVYLDAAFDRSGDGDPARRRRLRELNRLLPPEPPVPPEAFLDYAAMSRHLRDRGHLRYPEGELMALLNVDKPEIAGTPSIDARTQQAIRAAIGKPDYAAVEIPALAIYAFEDAGAPSPPWFDPVDLQSRERLLEVRRIDAAMRRENLAIFQRDIKGGEVVELMPADHNVVFSNASDVVAAIEAFAARAR